MTALPADEQRSSHRENEHTTESKSRKRRPSARDSNNGHSARPVPTAAGDVATRNRSRGVK
jgi:hypothetical protein